MAKHTTANRIKRIAGPEKAKHGKKAARMGHPVGLSGQVPQQDLPRK